MRAIVITGDRDSPGKKDYTGAFLPESKRFASVHGVAPGDIIRVDLGLTKAQRVAFLLAKLKELGKGEPFGLVGVLDHGLPRSVPRLGLGLAEIPAFVGVTASTKYPAIRVVMYACSNAADLGAPGGDGGFADKLRDGYCAGGAIDCQVDAHATAGHSTYNPNVRRFVGGGTTTGGIGGEWIVPPGSKNWKTWRTRLKSPVDDFRFVFPLMTVEAIHAALEAK